MSNPKLKTHNHNFAKALLQWHKKHRINRPWRKLFAQQQHPYPIWVAEIMLQQTTTKAVLSKYCAFMKRFPTIDALGQATTPQIRPYIAGLGYYRRFEWMHHNAKFLYETSQAFPNSYKELIKLKGIGPYTAAIIASICFNEPKAAVDGNVKRIMTRLGDKRVALNDPKLENQLQAELDSIIVRSQPGYFNEAIMELGQLICKQKPQCSQCPIKEHCLAYRHGSQSLNPKPKPKTLYTALHIHMIIYGNKQSIFIEKRPSNSKILSNTYGFPFTINSHKTANTMHISFGSFSHSITHYKITVKLYFALATQTPPKDMQSISFKTFYRYCVSSLDHKAMRRFLDWKTHSTKNQVQIPSL